MGSCRKWSAACNPKPINPPKVAYFATICKTLFTSAVRPNLCIYVASVPMLVLSDTSAILCGDRHRKPTYFGFPFFYFGPGAHPAASARSIWCLNYLRLRQKAHYSSYDFSFVPTAYYWILRHLWLKNDCWKTLKTLNHLPSQNPHFHFPTKNILRTTIKTETKSCPNWSSITASIKDTNLKKWDSSKCITSCSQVLKIYKSDKRRLVDIDTRN